VPKDVRTIVLTAFALAALGAAPVSAQSNNSRYNYCISQAQQQSGWSGTPTTQGQHAPLAGAAGGAIGGSLIGGMGGGNAGRGAAIGAAFGAIAGVARKSNVQEKQQNAEQNYYNSLNSCLAQ
jgi:hypothetical protein